MTERITVTLPDNLYRRLQVVKGKLNVSRLCQEAIEQAVTIEEIKMKDIPVKDKVVQRLRVEKEQSDHEWKETGVIDGMEDAQDLSYDDFLLLESKKISEETRGWIEEKRIEYLENPNKDAYINGWIEGALGFWEEVKKEVAE